jgi:DNA-binding HxlR family transcriptional regulator
VQILSHLSFCPRRLAEIRKELKTISEKVLTEQLRQFEKDGFVLRRAITSVPPQVTYSLNAPGKEPVGMLQTLCDWCCIHLHMKPSMPRNPNVG